MLLVCATGGCAHGICDDCPTATLTANGDTELLVYAGDMVVYAWGSTNADTGKSTVEMAPEADSCGNKDGPWVVATPSGTTPPLPILPCQAGTTYTLSFIVDQTVTGDSATAVLTIAVGAQ
jgi:hypothetical protein